MGQGTVYTVASGKGGVGKTTFSVNLSAAVGLADVDVVVIDADFGMANLADHLGIAAETPTVHDILAGRSDIDAAIRSVRDSLHALPGAVDLGDFATIDPDGLVEVVDHASRRFDVVVIDCGAGLSYETALPLGVADEVVLVTTPTSSSVQDTRKTAALAERMQTPVAGLVVNRTTPKTRMDPASVADRLDADLLGTIPDSAAVEDSLVAGTPLVWRDPHDPAAGAIRSIATSLTGVTIPDPMPTDLTTDGADEPADADEAVSRGLLARLLGR